MKVVIDARAFSWAGVGRYVRNLLKGLSQISSNNYFHVLLTATDFEKYRSTWLTQLGKQFTTQVVDSSYYSWREQLIFYRQIKSIKADLFHFPNFNIPILFNQPYVVTVHDVTRFIFPGQTKQSLTKQITYEYIFQRAVANAASIICVSNATRKDLLKLPLCIKGKITTIYEGIETKFIMPITTEKRRHIRLLVGTDKPYLLYVGVWMTHKNIPRLLLAFRKILQTKPDLKLVLTGKPKPGYVAVNKIAQQIGIKTEQVIYLGFVDDNHLPALYAEAAALLYPSLYEGFGLPAVEALATNTPVVTSNVSSLPEIAGPIAHYTNPESVDSIFMAIQKALSVKSNINQHKKYHHLQKFNWHQCANQTLQIYEQNVSQK